MSRLVRQGRSRRSRQAHRDHLVPQPPLEHLPCPQHLALLWYPVHLQGLASPATLLGLEGQTLRRPRRLHARLLRPANPLVLQGLHHPNMPVDQEPRTLRTAGPGPRPLTECAFSSDPLRNDHQQTNLFANNTRSNGGLIIFTMRRYVKPLFGESMRSSPRAHPVDRHGVRSLNRASRSPFLRPDHRCSSRDDATWVQLTKLRAYKLDGM